MEDQRKVTQSAQKFLVRGKHLQCNDIEGDIVTYDASPRTII